MNRGVGRRALFEHRREIRFFLSRLARLVRSGTLEIHAFAILPNHFHLLVRSPKGELSAAMRFAQDLYVKRFNWRRERTGPLVQGRFRSSVIETAVYWESVLRYIDFNPVRAGLSGRPGGYEYGSARYHDAGSGPSWLDMSLAEPDLWNGGPGRCEVMLVERRLLKREAAPDPLDRLMVPGAASEWMLRHARAADGIPPLALIHPDTLLGEIHSRPVDERVLPALCVGLLRSVCGLTFEEIGHQIGVSTAQTQVLNRKHTRSLTGRRYASLAGDVVETVLRAHYPSPRVRLNL
jgi:REP element-mobilizing transposase RayT